MKTDCVIIGAGHSGLAMSQCLQGHSIDHVVLERGEIANSWKQERWDSLRLLTPNWQTRLPGYAYSGDDPDAFMKVTELTEFIENYAEYISAPVKQKTTVTSVTARGTGFEVSTSQGNWQCKSLVIASGACNRPHIPAVANMAPETVKMVTPSEFRNPSQLEEAGVLVVGASASGLQLAEEIHRSGRAVTLAVGEHVRLPRSYRGKDIQWWLDQLGILDERYDEIDDIVRGRSLPSPQLVGSVQRSTLDLNRLIDQGIKIRGRLAGFSESQAQFSGSLKNTCALADLKMDRLLNSIDDWITANDQNARFDPPVRYLRTKVEESPPLLMNLADNNIKTILWATGYRPDYSWLNLPIIDHKGRIRHEGGIVDSAGVYLMGMPLMRRRKSSFIHGAADDARELSAHLNGYLRARSRSNRSATSVVSGDSKKAGISDALYFAA
jgi:putative flavoprotein involved in K+ transport